MTRVDAVARAIGDFIYGRPNLFHDPMEIAKAAIEANDSWLVVKWTCPNCEAKHPQDTKRCWLCETERTQ